MYIEIFKTGTHNDSKGNTGTYSPQDIDTIALNYKQRLDDNPTNYCPVVKGHPETDAPAMGWVRKLFRRADSLVADIDITNNDFANSIREGAFKNVSIALDNDLNFIHLGFLGAVKPAVEGLNIYKYSDVSEFAAYGDDEEFINKICYEYSGKINELAKLNQEYQSKINSYSESMIEKDAKEIISHFEKDNPTLSVEIYEDVKKLLTEARNDAKDRKEDYYREMQQTLRKIAEIRANDNSDNPKRSSSHKYSIERSKLHDKVNELISTNPGMTYEDALNYRLF